MKFVLAFIAVAAAADGDNGAKCLADDKCTKDTDACVQRTSEDADRKKILDTAGKTCEVKADTDCGKEKAKEVEHGDDKVKAKEYWDCPAAGAMGSLSAVAAVVGAMLIQ